MRYPLNALPLRSRATHFLHGTLVRAMEGVFFALVSVLFALSVAAMFFERSGPTGGAALASAIVAAASTGDLDHSH
jgi:hypothetical protein